MDTSNPGPLMMLGGGILMLVGPVLNWFPGARGIEVDLFGLLGLFIVLAGLFVLAFGAVRAFDLETGLPDEVGGFRIEQFCVVDAFASFLWSFALVFESGTRFGLHITWVGAAVATAGGLLALRQPAGSTAPPPPGGMR